MGRLVATREAVVKRGEIIERVIVGGDEHSAGGTGGCGDLQVVCSSGPAGAPRVGEQARVVAGDAEIEGDDVEGRQDGLDGGLTGRSTRLIGEFDADDEF